MSDISVDEFIKKNYRPVDDKPGYVWLNARRLEMISVANLAASLKEAFRKGYYDALQRQAESEG